VHRFKAYRFNYYYFFGELDVVLLAAAATCVIDVEDGEAIYYCDVVLRLS
jgi:hypothetical protein